MLKTNDVIGLGNTLMDFLIEVDDGLLVEFGLKKGEMHLIEEEKAKEILLKINERQFKIERIPGGSSANTLKGIAFLGGKAILCGKVGFDDNGEIYVQEAGKLGLSTRISKHQKITGHAITFITPDSERTFSVYLGAALELAKDDILEEDIAQSIVLHLEGYQVEGQTKETILHAIELAKKHDTLVSIDLADPGVIRRNKEFLKELVKMHVDIVFVNEKEAKEFTGLEEGEAAIELGKHTNIAIVKLGEKGSLICQKNKIVKIKSFPAKAVDTTGAGDSFAAGFLYGYCRGWNLEKSGKLGSLLASKVVEILGVKMSDLNAEKLKKEIDNETNHNIKKVKIGIIGGSGLDNPDILQEAKDIEADTSFGKPSSQLRIGKINGTDVVLLARHGREHTIPPTQVNFRANIQALKEAGCTHILATTACGSLKEEIGRGDFVILDQFIDFTRHRAITFHETFTPGKIVHAPMAEPFSNELRQAFIKTSEELGLQHHKKGTVVTIEGPRFSTRAESRMFITWGADVINMSIAPEVTLANEAGIPYAAVAMSTDFDCWKEDENPVTWEAVIKVFKDNVEKVTKLLINTVPKIISQENIKNTGTEFDLKSIIRTVPHWPKPGVMFRDITTLLKNPEAFNYCINKLKEYYQEKNITKVAGIEARGFIFGAVLAKELNLPFVVIRKPGKLPAETISEEYELEYGIDKIEIHQDAIGAGDNVLIVDDLLATGGTMSAACKLVERLGGNVAGIAGVVYLPDLKGKEKLKKYDVFHLVEFEGD